MPGRILLDSASLTHPCPILACSHERSSLRISSWSRISAVLVGMMGWRRRVANRVDSMAYQSTVCRRSWPAGSLTNFQGSQWVKFALAYDVFQTEKIHSKQMISRVCINCESRSSKEAIVAHLGNHVKDGLRGMSSPVVGHGFVDKTGQGFQFLVQSPVVRVNIVC